MNIFRLMCAIVFILNGSSLITAQQRRVRPASVPASAATSTTKEVKIGLVDTSIFGDEKEGIIRYRDAVKSVEAEFRRHQGELDDLKKRFDAASKDVEALSKASVVSQESIKAKREEAESLEREIKRKQEDAQKAFEKRYDEVTRPVSRDIGDALNAFAEQRGITLTLDISKLLPAILTIAPAADLTKEFVAEYNSKHPAQAPATRP